MFASCVWRLSQSSVYFRKHFCARSVAEHVGWLSGVWIFAVLWTAARQAPLSGGFSREEQRSGLPFSLDLPDPGIEPASPALAGGWILYHWVTLDALMKYLAQYYLLSWFEQYPYISWPRTLRVKVRWWFFVTVSWVIWIKVISRTWNRIIFPFRNYSHDVRHQCFRNGRSSVTSLKHKGELRREKATASDARNEETQIHSSKKVQNWGFNSMSMWPSSHLMRSWRWNSCIN